MKANLFAAAVLSLCVSFPLQAATNPGHSKSAAMASQSRIDLNKADAAILSQSVKGIGKKRAEAIVQYREEHGRFKSIEELAQVKGLGKQFVKNHMEQLQAVFTIG
ncbi:ComEA family DNA-binding protein [Legionella cardiaca]|uniref:Helix-hairpin-helix domain-containing protein n=1 Tax=Legionella cardiaca TaxID=1071983 RepID=A0ABY8ANL7_9GAMM|nr:helix-hairpin-helix domain-containing protein [Legionella cardiaca]WED41846.1 helix-hairpin-helix domain-containing protein [Legionella cardiaca]